MTQEATAMERYEPQNGGLVVMDQELTPQIFKDRIEREQQMRNILKEYVQQNMKEGHHFSNALGTTTLAKPMLLQEGTRNICSLFKLFFGEPKTTETHMDGGHFRVRAHVDLFNAEGVRIASGDGICSTREKKYAYLTGQRLCPECGQPTVRKDNKSASGGWYCWQKAGVSNGCSAKFAASDERVTSQQTGRVENPDIADLENTVLKMAIKRAKTAAVCDVPMVSEIFAPEGDEPDDKKPSSRTDYPRQSSQASRSAASRPTPAQSAPSAGQDASQPGVDIEALRAEVTELLNIKFGGDEDAIKGYLNGRDPDVMLQSMLEKMKGDLAAI